MNATRRPVSVWILSCLYIAVGIIGFAYYFPGLLAHQDDSLWAELTELLAIVSGVFMLRRHNWGTLACACLDGLPRRDQLPGVSSDGYPLGNLCGDRLGSFPS